MRIACSFWKLQNNQDVNGEVLDQKKIDRVEFKNLIIENIVIISRQEKDFVIKSTQENYTYMMSNISLRALRHQLIIPDFRGFTTKIDEIFTASRKITSGKNADYIPQVCISNWEKCQYDLKSKIFMSIQQRPASIGYCSVESYFSQMWTFACFPRFLLSV